MKLIRRKELTVDANDYQLLLFRIGMDSSLRLFILKGGLRVGSSFGASREIEVIMRSLHGAMVEEMLLAQAGDDVVRNDLDQYR
jgi:hypothetical protein